MNTIQLVVLPSPDSNDHQVRILIDELDWFAEDYLGIDPPRFFDQPFLLIGGQAIVARCICGDEGCDSILAKVTVDESMIIWETNKGRVLKFDKQPYLSTIRAAADDFSWETPERTAERLVTAVFRGATLVDGYCFDWASAQIRPGKIGLSFSRTASQKMIYIDWDGQNPSSAEINGKKCRNGIGQ
jgi:hypothetical protein